MPFKSQAQRRFMHAKHPEIADRWESEHNTPKKLPKKAHPAMEGLRRAAPKRKDD